MEELGLQFHFAFGENVFHQKFVSGELPKDNSPRSGGASGQISFKILKELEGIGRDAYDQFLKDLKGQPSIVSQLGGHLARCPPHLDNLT